MLRQLGRDDLAAMLRNATSDLEVSSTYGSRLFSCLSTFYIRCSPSSYGLLSTISEDDKKHLYDAVYSIYPIRDHEPEITDIIFEVNPFNENNHSVAVYHLQNITFDYVREQIAKCDEKITLGDFEGAVTNARNLLESTCLFIYEKITGEEYRYDGDLAKLHKKIADLFGMKPEIHNDQNLKRILTGVSSIIHGVAELRNSQSDAHGKTPSKISYRIDKRHAVLVVNLAKTVSEYLYTSFEKYQTK